MEIQDLKYRNLNVELLLYDNKNGKKTKNYYLN